MLKVGSHFWSADDGGVIRKVRIERVENGVFIGDMVDSGTKVTGVVVHPRHSAGLQVTLIIQDTEENTNNG